MPQNDSANFAVVLNNLRISFDSGSARVDALKGLTAQIVRGGITGLMGPDASGKTTLMRAMAGLLEPTSGTVEIFGVPALQMATKRSDIIGYMPQKFGLYEDITVLDNLKLYASLHGVVGTAKKDMFTKLLSFTSLKPFTERLAGNLSGGMKQKLGIACALLGNPRLLLLDEPGVGVDPRSRRELWAMVQELSKGGMTVVWSTSYLDEAERCPQLIMLDQGSILYNGVPAVMTQKTAGHVYTLTVSDPRASQEHRRALSYWTQRPGIMDALIQGKYLRLVTGGPQGEDAAREILQKGGKVTPPRLEDAYMCEIGGINKTPSPYANIGHIGSPQNSDSRIVADKLVRKFGNFTAVNNISFKVSAGEIVGLLGPNGAGKSTTFRMLCGLLRPTSGGCSVDGVDMLRSSSAARQRLGYMAQKFSLYPDIKVRENILIFASLYGVGKKQLKTLGQELVRALDLENWVNRVTATLPLGLKQRLALFCATLHEPPTLFLDEPTSGVDARTRRDFWKHISALTSVGAAVLVTTHFMEEAEYCDRIALIYQGSMISFGTPDELKATVTNSPNPTLEDAFIASIERYDKEHGH